MKTIRKPKKSKYYKLLTTAADIFIEKEISPAAWIGFSFEIWHKDEGHPSDDPPPLPWVFGMTKNKKFRGWFYGEGASSFRGGRVLPTKRYKKLLECYNLMRTCLSRLPTDATDAMIIDTVDMFFPRKTYDKWKRQINKETEEIQENLDSCLQRGDWLWSDNWDLG
jgi:hypothetical protein